MSETEEAAPPPGAWQPFTFGGLAAFASAGSGRLFLAQLVTAILAGLTVVWFLQRAWAPVILQAIEQMPESTIIEKGRLTGVDETLIAESKFFAVAITPDPSSEIGQSADVQVQFRPTDARVGSVFLPDWGWEFGYETSSSQKLGRSFLEPWWGAWRPVLLAGAGLAVVIFLFICWSALALVYMCPAICLAWFADRQLSWGGAWRLGSATLLPGSFLCCAAIILYARQSADLAGLAFFFVAHILMGWVYLAGGVWALPRFRTNELKQNPFAA